MADILLTIAISAFTASMALVACLLTLIREAEPDLEEFNPDEYWGV